MSACIALDSPCSIHQYPENASFLDEDERKWLVETIKNDTAGLDKTYKAKFLWQALRDPHSYLMAGIYFL